MVMGPPFVYIRDLPRWRKQKRKTKAEAMGTSDGGSMVTMVMDIVCGLVEFCSVTSRVLGAFDSFLVKCLIIVRDMLSLCGW